MTPRQLVYLALSIAGLLLTGYHNVLFMQEHGGTFSVGEFIDAAFSNHAAASIGWDITMACIAFVVWLLHEAKRIGMKHAWVYVVLIFTVAFGFAAPLFLLMRDRHLARTNAA